MFFRNKNTQNNKDRLAVPNDIDLDINPKVKTFFLSHRRVFQLSFGVLVLASVFFGFSIMQVYGQKKTNVELYNECKNSLNSARLKGIEVDDLTCTEATLAINRLLDNTNYSKILDQNNVIIEQRQAGLEISIQKLNANIRDETKIISANTSVDVIKELGSLVDNPNLSLDFSKKTDYYRKLLELKNTQMEKVRALISDYKKNLDKFDPKSTEETNYIDAFEKQENDTQLSKYLELQSKFKEIQLKLANQASSSTDSTIQFKTYSGAEFQNLYKNIIYPNTTEPITQTVITGDSASDEYIAKIAENRGYEKRRQAVESNLQSIDGERLQPEVKQSFSQMKQAASKDGIKLGLISGYRSVLNQKDLFNSRFISASKSKIGRAYTSQEILNGTADSTINQVLDTSSIPGYSRHHNGYTFDVTDSASKKDFTQFKDTAGYRWMSANNFYNAKRFGFIPSYPVGMEKAGPKPEAWEFVWVGVGKLLS